jgi:hypothetical protein
VVADITARKILTADSVLNQLISVAVAKFHDPRPEVRQESLEKLWDAWERLKTHYPGDKKQSVSFLLAQAIPDPALRARIDAEAREITDIGNSFMIRHSETNKPKISDGKFIDYLFHRLFSLVWLLTRHL